MKTPRRSLTLGSLKASLVSGLHSYRTVPKYFKISFSSKKKGEEGQLLLHVKWDYFLKISTWYLKNLSNNHIGSLKMWYCIKTLYIMFVLCISTGNSYTLKTVKNTFKKNELKRKNLVGQNCEGVLDLTYFSILLKYKFPV